MKGSIDELLSSGDKDPITGEAIMLIHRSKLVPDPEQDRNDWESQDTLLNISAIRKSAHIKLEDGSYYGIRTPLFVAPPDEAGNCQIIDGECRWRALDGAPEELQLIPCIVRMGGTKERRLDHTSANGARKGLTLYQTAMSIQKDEKEFGLSTEEIIAVHGLPNQTALSKFKAIHKLSDRAKELVRSGAFQDVNLVYELKKLDDEQLNKLEKRIGKGESIQQALKALAPKEPKPPKEGAKGPGTDDQNGGKAPGTDDDTNSNENDSNFSGLSESESSVSLIVGLGAAKALADLLGVPQDLDPKAMQAALVAAIKALAFEGAE